MSSQITDLLFVIALVAVGFLFAVVFYESLSDRDVYVRRPMQIARRASRHRPVIFLTWLVAIGVGIPLWTAFWTLVLTAGLFVVGSVERTTSAAFVAVAVIGATRVLAYARQKTAHELAKAIPLSFAFLLITGGSLSLTEKLATVQQSTAGINLTDEELILLMGIEVALRLTTDVTTTVLGAIRQRRGIVVADGAGVWRSLWAALRRPQAPITAAIGETKPSDG